MRATLAGTCILAAALVTGGCATKKFVRNTTSPIQAKVDKVGDQAGQNTKSIEETRTQVTDVDERAKNGISAAQSRAAAAREAADAAHARADEAVNKAGVAQEASDKNAQAIGALRTTIANLDEYKLQTTASVPFLFNQYKLTSQAKEELDKFAGSIKDSRRFFVAVEGFTDRTGTKEYNEALSRKRADAVVHYLVVKHNIPLYRIQTIGLGEEKPVDDSRTRAARAKNRRVEIRAFSADDVTKGTLSTSLSSNPTN